VIFLKLAALTCAFYLGMAFLTDTALFGLAHFMGGVLFFTPRLEWALVFGFVWLVLFLLAYQIVLTPKVPK
jgi:hypothetical protein